MRVAKTTRDMATKKKSISRAEAERLKVWRKKKEKIKRDENWSYEGLTGARHGLLAKGSALPWRVFVISRLYFTCTPPVSHRILATVKDEP